jgi:hypothetical protein
MSGIAGRILNPFGWQPEQYDPPVRVTHIHDMLCECQSRRCYGYTSAKWREMLSGEVE